MNNYKICKRCVMDNISDSYITFDEKGYCNYCTDALIIKNKVYFPNIEGEKRLNKLINRLKKDNKNKKYDCVMGISGGLDSAYLAYLGAVKWGLRILAVHVDDGYDTEISSENIKKLCKKANIELNVIYPDKNEYNMLTKAYIKAGVPNLAIPQDNVLFAAIYSFMKKYGIKTFLSGGNYSLESILQKGNTHDPYDVKNIRDINSIYGDNKLKKLKLISNFQRDIDSIFYRIESPRPLNYINYRRDEALKELKDFCDFEYYGSKHLENKLTKFIQVYWLYNKFNVDKRKSHLSSMIISEQITRDEALVELESSLYDENEMEYDIDTILRSLNISKTEFSSIMKEIPKQHTDYKVSNYNKIRKNILNFYRNVVR